MMSPAGWGLRVANPPESTRYIGSGEAASYRRLPPSEPQGPFMARTPARPDRAVTRNRRHDAGGSAFTPGLPSPGTPRLDPSGRSPAPAFHSRTTAPAPASARPVS